MPSLMEQLNNIVSPVVVDETWKVVGQHPVTHQTVYEVMRPVFTNEPRLDVNGEQMYRRHPMNGENSYALRRLVREEKPFRFVRIDPGNGNVRMEPYVEPSETEIRERDLAKRTHDLTAGLVHAMAERNVTPEQVIALVAQAAEQAQTAKSDAPVPQFPVNYAPGRWRLSDDTTMQGTREQAEDAESALHKQAEF